MATTASDRPARAPRPPGDVIRDSSTAMRTSRTAVLRSFLPVFYVLGVMQMFFSITYLMPIVACMNNMGPGLNVVGPAANYQPLTDFQTWICTLAMFIGRLEVLTVVVLLTPSFWKA